MLVTRCSASASHITRQNMRSELRREITESQSEQSEAVADTPFFSADQQQELSQAVASNILVKEEEGYIVTHSGLVLAALYSLLTLFRKRKTEAVTPQ